jgi:hypothetical protein
MPVPKRSLTKIEVAEAQLKYAVRLFFSEADPIPIETLVGAASGVLRGIAKRHGLQPPLHDSDLIVPERKGEWIRALHKEQNFFKHSDKDADEVLDYNAAGLQYLLFEVCHLYRHLASEKYLQHRQCSEGLIYEIWFQMAHPHLLKDPVEWQSGYGKKLEGINPKNLKFFAQLIDSFPALIP